MWSAVIPCDISSSHLFDNLAVSADWMREGTDAIDHNMLYVVWYMELDELFRLKPEKWVKKILHANLANPPMYTPPHDNLPAAPKEEEDGSATRYYSPSHGYIKLLPLKTVYQNLSKPSPSVH